jgi:hypothetical protein
MGASAFAMFGMLLRPKRCAGKSLRPFAALRLPPQERLRTHGKPTPDAATRDIMRTYVRQLLRSRFVVVR